MTDFSAVKDSGARKVFDSGMVRDVEDGKIDYTYLLDGPIMERFVTHLANGAKKYGKSNWLLADDQEALERYRRSAFRHLVQWLKGWDDEDHAMAVVFNINGALYVEQRLKEEQRVRINVVEALHKLGENITSDPLADYLQQASWTNEGGPDAPDR